jgi:hypothetical protein
VLEETTSTTSCILSLLLFSVFFISFHFISFYTYNTQHTFNNLILFLLWFEMLIGFWNNLSNIRELKNHNFNIFRCIFLIQTFVWKTQLINKKRKRRNKMIVFEKQICFSLFESDNRPEVRNKNFQ